MSSKEAKVALKTQESVGSEGHQRILKWENVPWFVRAL